MAEHLLVNLRSITGRISRFESCRAHMDNQNVDRLRVKTTITAEYTVIPTYGVESAKESEQSRSIEDMISLLRSMTPDSISYTVDFEEVTDVPQ